MNTTPDEILEARLRYRLAHTKYHDTIRRAHANGYSTRQLAKIIGVSHGTIHNIVKASEKNNPPTTKTTS